MRTLTEARVKAISEPGRYRAAPTLFLFCKTSGAKSWVQRVVVNGKRHDLGLGAWLVVTSAKARRRAHENLVLIEDGGDPLAQKRKTSAPTFGKRHRSLRGQPQTMEGRTPHRPVVAGRREVRLPRVR